MICRATCCEDCGEFWRCGGCQVAVDYDSEKCPTCGHWRCPLPTETVDGVEPGPAPRWFSVARPPGRSGALGSGPTRLAARSAATLAAEAGHGVAAPSTFGRADCHIKAEGFARIASFEVHGLWHVVVIENGAAAMCCSGEHGLALQRARANRTLNALEVW